MKICIIGGRGRMGRLFEGLFNSKGHPVSILGRQNYHLLKQEVNKAEITIVSSPLEIANKTIEDVGKVIKKDKLVVDFSSFMGDNESAMKKLPCSSAFIHPLFGPNVRNIKGLNFIVVPIKKNKSLGCIVNFFKSEQANITFSTVKEHDKTMTIIQGLTHFNNVLFAKTLCEQNIKNKTLNNFGTTLFRSNKGIVDAIFSQSPEMTMNIQFKNKEIPKLLEHHKKNFELLMNTINNKDKDTFLKVFNSIAKKIEVVESPKASKRIEKKWDKKAIAVMGPRGTFSDAASQVYITESNKNTKILLGDTIQEVIDVVAKGKVKEGIIPLENSIQGTIAESMDGVNYSNLIITKEIVIPIHHCCAGLYGKEIDTILSHPQALMQCSKFIEKEYPKARLIQTLSTAEAFQQIKEKAMPNALAIGPKIAAEIYGLNIVKENIEDVKGNKTKFIVISKKKQCDPKGKKISIVIFPYHEKTGLLFNMLKYLKEEEINLTRIESRPMKNKLGLYIFYIDIEGNIKEKRITQALKNINKNIGKIKILGCYQKIEE